MLLGQLVSVVAQSAVNETELLRLAASLKRGSEHPRATAIVAGAAERNIDLTAAQGFKSLTDRGKGPRRFGPARRQAACGWISPIVAAAAMSLSSVSVVGNALRLRRLRL